MTDTAKLIRSEHRFDPPEGAEPVVVTAPTRMGMTMAEIHPGDCELRVVVHSAVGVHAQVTGAMKHPGTGRPVATAHLSMSWTPGGVDGHHDLATAPQWVREAVAQVSPEEVPS